MNNGIMGRVIGIPENETIMSMIKKLGILPLIIAVIALSLAIYHLVTSAIGLPDAFRHRAIHLYAVLILIFLTHTKKKIDKKSTKSIVKISIICDICFVFIAAFGLFYTYEYSDSIAYRAGIPTALDYFVGFSVLILTIEAARRCVGTGIAVITAFFLFYVYYGPYFPGFLNHAPYSISEIINLQYLDVEGVWGVPLGAAASFVIIFLIFAGLLMQTGILNIFMDFALKIFGKSVGGPAKVAVTASTLVGSISGTAVANTLLTGQVSIPLMKKMGYKPTFAAGVEAGASTGGQVMPPIMGSTAFIIAMFLNISYLEVCKAALVPALLWFFSFFIIVHLEAKRLKLKPLSDDEVKNLPSWIELVKDLYIFIPLLVLVYILISGKSALTAGFWSVVALLLVSLVRAKTRFSLIQLLTGLRKAIDLTFPVTTACACAGIIVGCIMQSGLGYTLSASLIKISDGNLLVLLPLVMLAAIVLGVGMTTVGVYIIVSILVCPSLIDLGLNPLASHLFAFYFGIICNITPPVATAAYGAAGIAETSPWETGLTAFRLTLPIFCVPYVFITQPALLLIGGAGEILITIITTVLGVVCLDIVVAGYFLRNCSIVERILLLMAGIGLIFPFGIYNIIGAGIMFLITVIQKVIKSPEKA
jgi:TRAP transporter 4TM/12TM fusion protein